MRHFLLSLLALLGVSTMASAADAVVVNTVTLTQVEASTGVYDLSDYINSGETLTITTTGSSITFTAVGTVETSETTATYTTDSWSEMTISTLIAAESGWTIGGQGQESITWDEGSPTSLTLEGEGITKVEVGAVEVSVGMSYPSYVDLSSTGAGSPSVLALLQGTVTDNNEEDPTTYELLNLTIVFTSPVDHNGWSNVQVGGMYSGSWLCTATLVEEECLGEDQTETITCEDLKAAFETALQSSSISNKIIDYSNFTGLQIQVNGTVIKSVSYTYGTPATEELEPKTPANIGWSFDDVAFQSLQSEADVTMTSDFSTNDGLTITYGNGTVKFQQNGGSVMIGTQDDTEYPMVITPAYRLQLGTGSTSKANIAISVEKACDIYVVAASSNAEESRTVEVATTSSVLGTMTAINSGSQATTNCLQSVNYDGEEPETIYIYSMSSSINFFYIYVSYDGSAPEFADAEVVEPVAEPEWLFVGEYLCGTDEALGVSGSSNIVEITWAEIGDATAIKFEIVYNEGETTTWAPGAIYSIADFVIGKVANLPAETPQGGVYSSCEEIYTVEALKALVNNDEGFFFSGWDIYGINVYAYATELGSKDTESGTEGGNEGSSDDAVTVVVYEYVEGDMTQAVNIFDSADTNPFAAMTAEELATVEFHVVTVTAYDASAEDDVNNIGYSNFVFVGTDAVLNKYWMQAGNNWDVIAVPADGSSDNYTSFTIPYEDAIATMINNEDNELSEDYSFADLTSLKAQLWNASYFVYIDYTYTKAATSGTVEGGNDDEGIDTAISNINTEVTEVARYNLMGQKISGAERGINIIVYSDGSAKKVLVK